MIAELRIAKDHGAFAGHFPGFPILPGAVLLDEALYEIARGRTLDLMQWRIGSVKFLDTVRPGDVLTLEHTAKGNGIHFAIRNAVGVVTSGVLSAATSREHPDGG